MNVLSLCSGYAGLDLGLEIAVGNTRAVCYVEREIAAAALLVSLMESGRMHPAPVWDDLTTFDGCPWRGVVDCLTAGFPCQPFSVAGKQRGLADERWIWGDIARIIGECAPRLVFLENVPGLLSNFDALGAVLGSLEELGYRLAGGIFSAAEVGASHRRERLFIFGVAHHFDRGHQGERRTESVETLWDSANEAIRSAVEEPSRVLADPEIDRRREGRAESDPPRGADAAESDGAVADPGLGFVSLAWREPESGEGLGSRGADVADTECPEWGESAKSRYLDNREGCGRIEKTDRHSGGCENLASLPLFPPGPADTDAWRAVIEARPDLAPAVEPGLCRMAHGTPGRLDQLRMLGNGVVPLVAAYAFATLAARLGRE